jgi:hypothetical protein
MTMRRVFLSAVRLAVVAAGTMTVLAAAQRPTFVTHQQATFVMKSGDRHSGTLVYHNDNNFNLIENGQERPYPISDIAVVDFAGGDPAATELQQLPTSGDPPELQRHMLVLRDGGVVHGKLYTIKENALTFDTQQGQRQDFDLSNVSRMYVSAPASRQLYAAQLQAAQPAAGTVSPAPAPGAVPAGAGQAGSRSSRTGRVGAAQGQVPTGAIQQGAVPAGAIQVDGARAWTDTGITVRRGDRIGFSTSGQVSFRNGSNPVGPDGSATENRAGAPVQNVGVGGLIGRVGRGAPFAIGANSQWITMPAAGRLSLGINDSGVGDNSGAFVVTIVR